MMFKKKMFQLLSLFIAIIVVSSCNQKQGQDEAIAKAKADSLALADSLKNVITFRLPAEFEKHSAIWIGWPTYENKKGMPTEPLQMEIIKAIEPFVKVKIAVQDSTEIGKVKAMLEKNKIPTTQISFHIIPHGDIWFRDMGPNFLVTSDNKLKMADFNFNMWGYEEAITDNSMKEEKVDRLIAQEAGMEVISSKMITEAGNHEYNGKGTLMITESVFNQRNPSMTKEQMESELKRMTGVTKIIWLKKGAYEDDLTFENLLPGPDGKMNAYTCITTGGHIDELCRFVNPTTILLAEVSEEEAKIDPVAKENRIRFEENFEILKNATDQDGKPFTIIRIPAPVTLYETMKPGDGVYDYIAPLKYQNGIIFPKAKKITVIPAISYLNFLITNNIVLAQKYWKPGKSNKIKDLDAKALEIIQAAFPDRKVVALDAMPINLGGGGIHCITMQEPALN